MYQVNETHDINLTSWVESANDPACEFPIQNLPFCIFMHPENGPTVGVGIGDKILNLGYCGEQALLPAHSNVAACDTKLNSLMELNAEQRGELRACLSELLSDSGSALVGKEDAFVEMDSATFEVPAQIGDYTDFYASIFHARNVGSMFRPNNPLLPNYKHIPIGYHGRASSVVVSGTEVRRPVGQQAPAEEGGSPGRGPCKLLDYELEVGFYVSQGNELGESISIDQAESRLFGMCLVNDWSARDIQKWEYVPLGPFLAKSFATTVSPWVITMEALAPFRCAALKRDEGDPAPMDYLHTDENQANGGVDIKLEVALATAKMRESGHAPQKLSSGSFTNMYWTIAQILTHHSSNGCNMQPGDLMASGTVSGTTRDSRGCLLELTWDGEFGNPVPGTQRTPIELPTGEERKFLGDGDELIISGYCQADGFRRIGFGQCAGIVAPARV
jgi:fumarylacetoacetase